MSQLFAFNASNSITRVIEDGAYDSAHQVWVGSERTVGCSVQSGQALGNTCDEAYKNAEPDCARRCAPGQNVSGYLRSGCWTNWWGGVVGQVDCNCGC
ncbi:MAG: hypothetical protein GFH27_549291n219 [Chloroflexi bacterium AL-W]|nr:hypothetical protein [Chloroflexi bacterium AL-N1]NOK67313.1 hypothetical protein [Chloroflexi bacterium AL-N10]NOK75193.1 hypothetical protein [Chloroflexi bacterium AL-N5]NOK81981.1 hypothetical protein [Chloroflexi bacterium AL-W]NOK89826.1 hypothetical protein [Chloroflexi bacterium AL-N15]